MIQHKVWTGIWICPVRAVSDARNDVTESDPNTDYCIGSGPISKVTVVPDLAESHLLHSTTSVWSLVIKCVWLQVEVRERRAL